MDTRERDRPLAERLTGRTSSVKSPFRFVPPDPPITPKAAATRRLLIDIAADLFIARGYAAVSMQDIADRAEITKGGVYGHFRSKGQLLVEVIRWKLADFDREHVVDAVRQLDTAACLMVDHRGRTIRLLEVDAAAAARHDPDVAAGLRELYRDRHAAIQAALGDGVPDPETISWLIGALALGIGATEAVGLRPPTLKRAVAGLQALLSRIDD